MYFLRAYTKAGSWGPIRSFGSSQIFRSENVSHRFWVEVALSELIYVGFNRFSSIGLPQNNFVVGQDSIGLGFKSDYLETNQAPNDTNTWIFFLSIIIHWNKIRGTQPKQEKVSQLDCESQNEHMRWNSAHRPRPITHKSQTSQKKTNLLCSVTVGASFEFYDIWI